MTVLLDEARHESRSPLLGHHEDEEPGENGNESLTINRASSRISLRLYVSHFLSTWNARVFEFGAVLYLASIYPDTLFPMSVYALCRGLAALLFAPLIGQYIDTEDRLKVVRNSIVIQRAVVAVSCAIFYSLCRGLWTSPGLQNGMLALLAALACIEKLASILNMIAVERDWVVVVAENDPDTLRLMNSQMRRIDLLCKLIGPLAIALLDGLSTEAAIIFNFAMNVSSIIVEYVTIARVYSDIPALQATKLPTGAGNHEDLTGVNGTRWKFMWRRVGKTAAKTAKDFVYYFSHAACLPSFAGALLYLTVLSFSGQMVTYLLASGYSSTEVGIARTFSVAFEVLATWIAPLLMGKVGPIRAGLWLSSWQLTTLVAGLAVFWSFLSNPSISASGLVVGTILSRVGLFGFDLCCQAIVQEDVEADHRGAFSSVEAALQNAFELLSFASTIVFSGPQQFKWPTLMSTVAIGLACLCYACFVRTRRKHLVHLEYLGQICCHRTVKRSPAARPQDQDGADNDSALN